MKFYVAGNFSDYRRVRMMIDFLRVLGHECTHDWTRTEEFNEHGDPKTPAGRGCVTRQVGHMHSENDLDGVRLANFVVILADGDLCGAWIELGAALTSDSVDRVFVLETKRWTIFLEHDKVVEHSIKDFLILAIEGL